MRVDCGCQNESEAEASRSSHSTCDYLQQSEKQIQCRLLPQPVDTSCTKHFADYSGCGHTTASHSLLVSSAQSIDYEEVLCVSVPSRREDNEPHYACVNDNVICKPPCSIGIINNNFSLDASSFNNNVLQPQFNDNVKLVLDAGSQSGNGSNESSDVSSAGSSIDDHTSAEVKYVADIRQFQSAQTSARPHGEDCCCSTCQSVNDGVDGAENSGMIRHHSSDVKCSCKTCREFHSRMYVANRDFATTVGVNAYRLISSVAQDVEHIPITWSQSPPKLTVVSRIAERAKFDSGNAQSTHESAPVSANRADFVLGAFRSDEADDDNGLFSSDDELHYVFHKFIDDGVCLGKQFTGISTDGRLRPDAAASSVVHSEPGAELEHTLVRSADDLEVAYFMVGSISPGSPSTVFPAGSYVTPTVPASVAVSTECETAASKDSVTSVTDHAAGSYTFVTEPSAYGVQESLSAIVSDTEPYSLNVVCKDVEADSSADVFETGALNAGSPRESVNLSDALRIEAREPETDFYVGSNLNVLDNENQQSYSQPGSSEVKRDVIVRRLSDSSSLFIELPAADSEHVSTENMSVPVASHTDGTCTVEEFAPAADDVVIEQSLEIVTPQCITEHPVSASEAVSLWTVDDASYGHDQKHRATDLASYVHGIVAEAVQQIADNASVGICNVASEAEDTSSELPKQILITSAPLPSTYHQLVTDNEYDKQMDNILNTAADDLEPRLASVDTEYVDAGIVDIGVLSNGVDISWSKEAVCVTGIEIQEVAPVEHYLISYDVHLLQQPVDDDADHDVDRALMWSSHSSCPDKSIAYGDVKLQDLVQPLEHVVSESEGDVTAAAELNLDSDDLQTGRQDADQAASALSAAPIDIVEDFFMQYVLPVDSVGYNIEKDAAVVAAEHRDDAVDQAKVDRDEDLVQAKKLEIAAEKIIDVVIGDAVAETQVDVAAASTELGVQCEEVVDEGEVDWDLEGVVEGVELEAVAEAIVDVVISDASGDLATGPTLSLTAAGDDAQLLVPTRSSCLLQSPSESHRKKSVHFADTHGLQLETVQRYDQTPEPEESLASLEEFLSKLSAAAAERRAKWTEHHPSRASPWLSSSSVYLLACFELPASQEELLERVRRCRVALESCSFDDMALAITGVVRVANIAFHKKILVRYSVDRWTTQTNIDGEYIPRSNDGTTDRFSFTIILPSRKQFVVGSEVQFAICYLTGDCPSFEFWDNNNGRNYIVRCCSKASTRDSRDAAVSSTDNCSNNNDSSE